MADERNPPQSNPQPSSGPASYVSVDCDNHCVIVIGASSGGVEALKRLVAGLPVDLPAAVFIVLHVGSASILAEILARYAVMPVEDARNGARIQRGRIYVAPPGKHLLLHDHHMLLRQGPKENHTRPGNRSVVSLRRLQL